MDNDRKYNNYTEEGSDEEREVLLFLESWGMRLLDTHEMLRCSGRIGENEELKTFAAVRAILLHSSGTITAYSILRAVLAVLACASVFTLIDD